MAKFSVQGFDEMEAMILKRADDVEYIAPYMLKTGAEVLVAGQKAELARTNRGKKSTGTLAGSIDTGKVKKSATSIYIDVYPKGKQPHGTPRKGKKGMISNAQVGFMRNYGHVVRDRFGRGIGFVYGDNWMERAVEKNADAIQKKMREVWERKK